MSQSDTELREAIVEMLYGYIPQEKSTYDSKYERKSKAEECADKAIALFTQAKNELLQELLEQGENLFDISVVSDTLVFAVPVQVIEKYLAKETK